MNKKDKRDRMTKKTEGEKNRRRRTEGEGQKEIYYVYMILL